MAETPREVDRYEEKARELVRRNWIDHTESTVKHIAAALRAAEADAIERAAQAIEAIEGGGSLYRNGLHAAAARVRALVSPESPPAITETQYAEAAEARNEPAAAPAAETVCEKCGTVQPARGVCMVCVPPSEPAAPCTCHYEAAEFCRYHGPLLKAERASGVAPAPVNCWIQLRNAEKRIAELEGLLRHAAQYVAWRGVEDRRAEMLFACIIAALEKEE